MWPVSDAFKAELRKQHVTACLLEILTDDFTTVQALDNSQTSQALLTNFLSDGNIDVDTTRGTRRTAEVTILNPNAEFTPALQGFTANGAWAGVVYINRIVRLSRGVMVNGIPEMVPVGTFMVDNAEVIVERNISIVTLTLSDLWKKLAKSYLARPKKFPAGTPYNNIISELVNEAGADEPLAPILSPLGSRGADDKKTDEKIIIEEGTSRGDALKEYGTSWDIDMYFDPTGRFVSQDRMNPRDRDVVWEFYSSPNNDGMLLNVSRQFNDDNLYNHVIVIGGTSNNPIRREQIDTATSSKFNIDKLGDRVMLIKDDKLKTLNKVMRRLDEAWKMRFQIAETTSFGTICNPALEGDDVIRVTETDWAFIDNTYRLTRFNIPLVTSRQQLQVVNILDEDNLYV